ncbi:MAG: hypothetical protein N2691_00355 [Patescibacteria group bacterium]|nr:hypothetical protein [Patescibacteria group bacterium]
MKIPSRYILIAILLGSTLLLILLSIAVIIRMRQPDTRTPLGAELSGDFGNNPTISPFPSPQSGFGSTSRDFRILSVEPDQETPLATTGASLVIRLSQPVTTTGIKIEFNPAALYGYQVTNDTVRIRFARPLEPGRQYAYAITKDTGEAVFGLFLTAGPTPTPGIMVNDPAINETIDKLQLQENPDLYLHNRIPYETDRFRITSELRTEPETYYAFRVVSRDGTDVQAEVEAWMRSIGLPQSAIDRLSITYE